MPLTPCYSFRPFFRFLWPWSNIAYRCASCLAEASAQPKIRTRPGPGTAREAEHVHAWSRATYGQRERVHKSTVRAETSRRSPPSCSTAAAIEVAESAPIPLFPSSSVGPQATSVGQARKGADKAGKTSGAGVILPGARVELGVIGANQSLFRRLVPGVFFLRLLSIRPRTA
jgi:hypothetical protein